MRKLKTSLELTWARLGSLGFTWEHMSPSSQASGSRNLSSHQGRKYEGKDMFGASPYTCGSRSFSGGRSNPAACSVQKQLGRSSQMAPRLVMCHVAVCASDFITIFVPSCVGEPRCGSHKGLVMGGRFWFWASKVPFVGT